MIFGYVCTNYNSTPFTRTAIESLTLDSAHSYRIVVVDNASAPDSVRALQEVAARNANVELILSDANKGYFAGLNAGLRLLRSAHPEVSTVIIGNNDLEFPKGFGSHVLEAVGRYPDFPVLSPDIVTLDGVHQNPHVISPIGRIRECAYDLYYLNYTLAGILRVAARLLHSATRRPDVDHHGVPQPIHQGFGAAYILTPAFFGLFDALWAPTFLMGEEFFLSRQLADVGRTVFYDPSILVRHNYHATLGNIPSSQRWSYARDAHRVYRQYVKPFRRQQPAYRPPRPYQICVSCVMDTSDAKISFDNSGRCDHCTRFMTDVLPKWHPNDVGRAKFSRVVDDIRRAGKGKEFDCILGLSGGVDSSFLLHAAVKEFGLRPLVFHVDGGWNTDVAVQNIQSLVDKLGLNLFTEVINWNEMRDFQLAFFKAGVPHLDVPQDHCFVSCLYHFANQHDIKYILNGGNVATECVRNPLDWMYYGTDMVQLKDIHRKFGSLPLKTYPFSSIFHHKIYLRLLKGVRVVKPLDWMPYTQRAATRTLSQEYGWKHYPQKHFESRFTRFYEGYWLPRRFGFDTRRVQYSSLILTGQMTRDEALNALKRPSLDNLTVQQESDYVAKKLGISSDELRSYFVMPRRSFRDFRNRRWIFELGARALRAIGAEKAIKR